MLINNNDSGALLGMAMGGLFADQVFRNIVGFKLLQDDNKNNDAMGLMMIANDSNPFRNTNRFMPQPPRLGR